MMDDKLIEVNFIDRCRVLNVLRKHQLTCNGEIRFSPLRRLSLLDRFWATGFTVTLQGSWHPMPNGNGQQSSFR